MFCLVNARCIFLSLDLLYGSEFVVDHVKIILSCSCTVQCQGLVLDQNCAGPIVFYYRFSHMRTRPSVYCLLGGLLVYTVAASVAWKCVYGDTHATICITSPTPRSYSLRSS